MAKTDLSDIDKGSLTMAELLDIIREQEEITQAEMARRLDIPRQHLWEILNEIRYIGPELAARFASMLGYPEALLVRVALQDQLRRNNLNYTVQLKSAKGE